MNVLVFGASGKTGREVVRQALARGFNVAAFVRDTARLPLAHANLRLVKGQITDPKAVARAIEGHTCVISTLGVGLPLRHDPIVIEGVRTIARASEHASVKRLLYMSFIGVSQSRDSAGFLLKQLAGTVLRHEVADHEVKEAAVAESLVDWTIVRAPKLTNGRLTASYRVGEDIEARSPLPMMSRADVADFMLRQLSDQSFIRKAVRILH
jgi:putative NADH-flavin reductase